MGLKVHTLVIGAANAPVDQLFLNYGALSKQEQEKLLPFGFKEDMKWKDGSIRPGIDLAFLVFFIEGADKNILVDTGFGDCQKVMDVLSKYNNNQIYWRKPEWEIERQLDKLGLRPSDIDIVLHTHLHFDHCANNELFSNAKFIVQAEEIAWALNPPPYGVFWFREFGSHILNVRDRVIAIDGDMRITDGVEVWKIGGHTPGGMAVAVDTKKGRVVLLGDAAYVYRNVEFKWPIGAFWRLDQIIAAYNRAEMEGDIVVPGHDFEFFEFYPDGFIG